MSSMTGFSRRRRRGASRRAMSEINVTPFVDVMLVLLAAFMVTAPLLTSGVELSLPKGEPGQTLAGQSRAVNVGVARDGSLYLASQPVAFEDLEQRVSALLRANPDLRIVISAEEQAPYGRVVRVMGRLKSMGISNVGLETRPPQKGDGEN